MKKIFENWRRYKKHLLIEDLTFKGNIGIMADIGWADPKTDRLAYIHHQKAEAARGAFIQATILNKRKKVEREIAKHLSLIEDVASLPTPSIFVDNIVKFVESTKIRFTHDSKDDYGLGARRGGSAMYWGMYNIITFFNLEDIWAKQPRRFTKTVYHELGHAVDEAITRELKNVRGEGARDFIINILETVITHWGRRIPFEAISGPIGGPSGAAEAHKHIKKRGEKFEPWETASRFDQMNLGGYSGEIIDKIKSITVPGIVPHPRVVQGSDPYGELHVAHKELVYEFFASLKELITVLGRDILPIDIEMYCAFKNKKNYTSKLVRDWASTVEAIKDDYDAPKGSPEEKRWKSIWSSVIRIETMRMLDCSKDPNFIAKVLNELI